MSDTSVALSNVDLSFIEETEETDAFGFRELSKDLFLLEHEAAKSFLTQPSIFSREFFTISNALGLYAHVSDKGVHISSLAYVHEHLKKTSSNQSLYCYDTKSITPNIIKFSEDGMFLFIGLQKELIIIEMIIPDKIENAINFKTHKHTLEQDIFEFDASKTSKLFIVTSDEKCIFLDYSNLSHLKSTTLKCIDKVSTVSSNSKEIHQSRLLVGTKDGSICLVDFDSDQLLAKCQINEQENQHIYSLNWFDDDHACCSLVDNSSYLEFCIFTIDTENYQESFVTNFVNTDTFFANEGRQDPSSRIYSYYLSHWKVLLATSSTDFKIAVFTKNSETNVFELVPLKLPVDTFPRYAEEDAFPIGFDIDLCYNKTVPNIREKSEGDHPTPPLVHAYLTSGEHAVYYFAKFGETKAYPNDYKIEKVNIEQVNELVPLEEKTTPPPTTTTTTSTLPPVMTTTGGMTSTLPPFTGNHTASTTTPLSSNQTKVESPASKFPSFNNTFGGFSAPTTTTTPSNAGIGSSMFNFSAIQSGGSGNKTDFTLPPKTQSFVPPTMTSGSSSTFNMGGAGSGAGTSSISSATATTTPLDIHAPKKTTPPSSFIFTQNQPSVSTGTSQQTTTLTTQPSLTTIPTVTQLAKKTSEMTKHPLQQQPTYSKTSQTSTKMVVPSSASLKKKPLTPQKVKPKSNKQVVLPSSKLISRPSIQLQQAPRRNVSKDLKSTLAAYENNVKKDLTRIKSMASSQADKKILEFINRVIEESHSKMKRFQSLISNIQAIEEHADNDFNFTSEDLRVLKINIENISKNVIKKDDDTNTLPQKVSQLLDRHVKDRALASFLDRQLQELNEQQRQKTTIHVMAPRGLDEDAQTLKDMIDQKYSNVLLNIDRLQELILKKKHVPLKKLPTLLCLQDTLNFQRKKANECRERVLQLLEKKRKTLSSISHPHEQKGKNNTITSSLMMAAARKSYGNQLVSSGTLSKFDRLKQLLNQRKPDTNVKPLNPISSVQEQEELLDYYEEEEEEEEPFFSGDGDDDGSEEEDEEIIYDEEGEAVSPIANPLNDSFIEHSPSLLEEEDDDDEQVDLLEEKSQQEERDAKRKVSNGGGGGTLFISPPHSNTTTNTTTTTSSHKDLKSTIVAPSSQKPPLFETTTEFQNQPSSSLTGSTSTNGGFNLGMLNKQQPTQPTATTAATTSVQVQPNMITSKPSTTFAMPSSFNTSTTGAFGGGVNVLLGKDSKTFPTLTDTKKDEKNQSAESSTGVTPKQVPTTTSTINSGSTTLLNSSNTLKPFTTATTTTPSLAQGTNNPFAFTPNTTSSSTSGNVSSAQSKDVSSIFPSSFSTTKLTNPTTSSTTNSSSTGAITIGAITSTITPEKNTGSTSTGIVKFFDTPPSSSSSTDSKSIPSMSSSTTNASTTPSGFNLSFPSLTSTTTNVQSKPFTTSTTTSSTSLFSSNTMARDEKESSTLSSSTTSSANTGTTTSSKTQAETAPTTTRTTPESSWTSVATSSSIPVVVGVVTNKEQQEISSSKAFMEPPSNNSQQPPSTNSSPSTTSSTTRAVSENQQTSPSSEVSSTKTTIAQQPPQKIGETKESTTDSTTDSTTGSTTDSTTGSSSTNSSTNSSSSTSTTAVVPNNNNTQQSNPTNTTTTTTTATTTNAITTTTTGSPSFTSSSTRTGGSLGPTLPMSNAAVASQVLQQPSQKTTDENDMDEDMGGDVVGIGSLSLGGTTTSSGSTSSSMSSQPSFTSFLSTNSNPSGGGGSSGGAMSGSGGSGSSNTSFGFINTSMGSTQKSAISSVFPTSTSSSMGRGTTGSNTGSNTGSSSSSSSFFEPPSTQNAPFSNPSTSSNTPFSFVSNNSFGSGGIFSFDSGRNTTGTGGFGSGGGFGQPSSFSSLSNTSFQSDTSKTGGAAFGQSGFGSNKSNTIVNNNNNNTTAPPHSSQSSTGGGFGSGGFGSGGFGSFSNVSSSGSSAFSTLSGGTATSGASPFSAIAANSSSTTPSFLQQSSNPPPFSSNTTTAGGFGSGTFGSFGSFGNTFQR